MDVTITILQGREKENMKIKKVQSICLILTCIAATGLIGCRKTDEASEEHEAITFMAPYLEVDSFIEEVHKTYPEVNLEVITYSGSNTTTYLQNMLEADDLPDICTQTFYKPDVVDVSDKMIDLSGYDFTDNYVESRLKEVSDEGALYMLPSSDRYGIRPNLSVVSSESIMPFCGPNRNSAFSFIKASFVLLSSIGSLLLLSNIPMSFHFWIYSMLSIMPSVSLTFAFPDR